MCALGLKDLLVGRSPDCDFPPLVGRLPVCTSPEIIASLKPDVVIAEVNNPLLDSLGKKIKRVSLEPRVLGDIWSGVSEMAEALGAAEMGKNKIVLYQNKLNALGKKSAGLEPKPRVAAIGSIDPLKAGGKWIPELIKIAGGRDLFGKAGEPSRQIHYEDLIKSDPDIILVFPSGFNIEKTRDELEPFSAKKGWFDLKAVQHNQVFLIDGNHYMNRPGPRLVDSLEMLAEIFHPDDFDFGHKNSGWQYWGFNRF